MAGYSTSFLNDVEVDSKRWRWVRLDPVTASDAELARLALKDPAKIYEMLQKARGPLDRPSSSNVRRDGTHTRARP